MKPSLVLLALVVVLSACGGGGGGTPQSAPVVTSVTPATVFSGASTFVTIRGERLDGATAAQVRETSSGGTRSLTGVSALDAETLTATVPAGVPVGVYDVLVTTSGGTNAASAQHLVVVATPVVNGLLPVSGFNDRTTVVRILGSGLSGATKVMLDDPGGATLTSLVVLDDTRIDAVVPAGVSAGSWNVRVTAPTGANTSSTPRFEARNLIDPDAAGAFLVGTEDASIPGASGDAPAARVYYPALASGTNAAPDAVLAPYPAVVFNHAYKPPVVAGGIDYKAYGYLCRHLASFGYVVISVDMVPNNNLLQNLGQNAKRDANDARAALSHLATRAATPGDRLFGLVSTSSSGIGGHSRGGDASLIACADDVVALGAGARFKAVFVLGSPYFDLLAGGTPIPFGNYTSIPCMAVGGSRDTIAPFLDQQNIYWAGGPPSEVFEIVGATHSQYTDSGQYLPGDGLAAISLAAQQVVVRRYVVAWMGYHVKGLTMFFAPHVLGGSILQGDARLQNQAWK